LAGDVRPITSGAESVSFAMFGQYSAGKFTIRGDGAAGTPVGDPPVGSGASPLDGVNYVADVYGSYADASSLASLQPVGVNTVALVADFGINATNSTVYQNDVAGGYTESDADIATTIDAAVRQGLSAMVRPLIDFLPSNYDTAPGQTNPLNGSYNAGEWRTYYNPANVAAFFASYQTMIVREATLAQENGATIFCIGTELDQLTGPAYETYWDNIISAVRSVFSGRLTYAADWDDALSPWQYGGTGLAAGTGNITTQISFWNQLDYVGIDEYAPISQLANPTLNELIAGWTQTPTDPTTLAVTGGQSLISYYEGIAAAVGRPLVFTEIGYANSSDADSSPATPGYDENGHADGAVADPTLQADLYRAYFDAWRQDGNGSLAGAYLWNWEPDPNPGNDTWTVQGEPALSVVTSAYTNNGAQPDFNGDGISDVLWCNTSTGEVDTWLMNNGQMAGGTVVSMVSSAWQFAGAGDITGSGTSDVLWQNTSSGEVDTWLINNGDISGGAAVGHAASVWQPLGTGDFNADGVADVLWRNTSTGEVDTWLMNNGQVSGGTAVGAVSSAWQFTGIGDFNGDGTRDILWHNTTTGEVDTWLINNGHLVGGAAIGHASSVWQSLGTGDFNGDGTSDVLWRNATTGEVDTWLMTNGQMIGGTALGTMSSAWQFAGIGDYTGNGTSDVAWRNTTTGQVQTWLIGNDHVTGGSVIGTVSSVWQPQVIHTG
jgi:hypothetical protein